MVILNQVRVAWTGMKGGPGVSTFYFDDEGPVPLSDIKAGFELIKNNIHGSVLLTYPGTGAKIDPALGQPVGTWTATAPSSTQCTGAGAYAAACGGLINWHTGAFVNGREVRGKTFLVPFAAANYTTDGQMSAGAITPVQNAAAAILGAVTDQYIYSPASHGAAKVVSASVPSKVVVLRSRRD